MKDVFLSHCSTDIETARKTKAELEKRGISVWLAADDIPAGGDHATLTPYAIKTCTVFLLLLSKDSQESEWVSNELNIAVGNKKPIIPYRIDKSFLTEKFAYILAGAQVKDSFSDIFPQINEKVKSSEKKPLPEKEEEENESVDILSDDNDKGSFDDGEGKPYDAFDSDTGEPYDAFDSDAPDATVIDEAFIKNKVKDIFPPKKKKKKSTGFGKKVLITLLLMTVLGLTISAFYTFSSVLHIGNDNFSKLDTEISLSDATLYSSDIDKLSRFKELHEITFYRCTFAVNSISDFPVEKLHTLILQDCNISQNIFDTIDFSKAETLLELDISGCESIDRIPDFEEIGETLTTLKISGTKISDLEFLRGKKLVYLFIDSLGLSSLDALSESIYLESLSAEENELVDIYGLKNCTVLWNVSLKGNTYISDIDVLEKSAETLEALDLSGNMISDISVLGKCQSLKELNISDNKISSLEALSQCSELHSLDASKNRLTDINGLTGSRKFKYINLSDNEIEEITTPISFNNSQYAVLILMNNKLHTLVLDENSSYSELLVQGNPLTNYEYLSKTTAKTFCGDYIDTADITPVKENAIYVYLPLTPLDKQVKLEKEIYDIKFTEPEDTKALNIYIFSPVYFYGTP